MPTAEPSPMLRRLAWLNVVTHLVGLALAGLCLRPGSPLVPLEERLRYLSETPMPWMLTWSFWIVCAIALVAFLGYVQAERLRGSSLAAIGVTFAVVGFGFDLGCDCIFIAVFPNLASASSDPARFLLVERIVGIFSLTVANGFYTVGVLCVNGAIPQASAVPGMRWTGYAVGGFGLALALTGITGNTWHAALATAPTLLFFCVWVVLVARSFERQGAAA